MAYVLLALLIILFFWPAIKRWLARQAANRAEDYIRRAAGLPPRPGSRRERRQNARQDSRRTYARKAADQRHTRRNDSRTSPIIPPEYAEDVDFVETVEWSQTTITAESESSKRRTGSFKAESQVSDAEWVEIKSKRPQ